MILSRLTRSDPFSILTSLQLNGLLNPDELRDARIVVCLAFNVTG